MRIQYIPNEIGFYVIFIDVWASVSVCYLARFGPWSHFNDVCASWVFLPSEHESSVPSGDVVAATLPLCLLCCGTLPSPSSPFSLWDLIVSHLYDRYVLADSHEQSTAVVNKNEFLATSITHTHTHTHIHTHTHRQTHTAPPHIHLPWLAGLVSAHARTCSLAQGLRHLSDRERLSLCSHHTLSEEHTLVTHWLSWADVSRLDIKWKQVGALAGRCIIHNMI